MEKHLAVIAAAADEPNAKKKRASESAEAYLEVMRQQAERA